MSAARERKFPTLEARRRERSRVAPPPRGPDRHQQKDGQAGRAVQQQGVVTRECIARSLADCPAECHDDDSKRRNQPMQCPRETIVNTRLARKAGERAHSSEGNAISTRPSGPKSAAICAPRFVNTMPVQDPVVIIVPALAPPRPFIRLANSTSAPTGSRAAPPVLSAKGWPSSVTTIVVPARSSDSQFGTAGP